MTSQSFGLRSRDRLTVHDAYEKCASITREQARNFHYGIRLLPPDKRAALSAVYAVARRVDDVGDSALPSDVKVEGLRATRVWLRDLDSVEDPVGVALRDAARRYPLPLDAFDELIDGVEMDVIGATFATFDELERYCRCVAGSIGRLSLAIFTGSDDPVASSRADKLGIALQQTNILRDIREDLLNGRVYLPQDDLDRFGVQLRVGVDGALVDDDGGLTALVRAAAERARQWYAGGSLLVPMLDRRSAACCAAMAGIYRRLLDRIAAEPALVFRSRLSLSGWEKSVVAARALVVPEAQR